MSTLVASNTTGSSQNNLGDAYIGESQSFNGTGINIYSASFNVKKVGTPTGNAYIKLYTHSGTFGTSSVPGVLLTTSDAIDVSTIGTSDFEDKSALFTLLNRYFLVNGTHYCIAIEYDGGDVDNYLNVRFSSTSVCDGNYARKSSGSWAASADRDYKFAVYGEQVPPTITGVSTIQGINTIQL